MESFIRNAKKRNTIQSREDQIGYANIKIIGCGGASVIYGVTRHAQI